jgi:hypothetical protein
MHMEEQPPSEEFNVFFERVRRFVGETLGSGRRSVSAANE